MSALVESIGGTTRIILAQNNSTGGHAYTEVYLGRLNSSNSQVNNNINWVKQEFGTDKIYTHVDTNTKDVWLNLDWSADHPGGPFYQGYKHIVLCIRDTYQKTPLTIPTSDQEVVNRSRTNVAVSKNVTLLANNTLGTKPMTEPISANNWNNGGGGNTLVGQSEIHSTVTNVGVNQFTFDNSSFAGFYYDIDKNLGHETLTFRLTAPTATCATLSDQPDDNNYRGVVYETKAQLKTFKYEPWGEYVDIGLLGEGYFAAYDPTVTADVTNAGAKVAVLYDTSENRNLMVKQTTQQDPN